LKGWPLRIRKPVSRIISGASGRPIKVGPPAPVSIVAEPVAPGDRNLPFQNDEHAGAAVAGLEQQFAVVPPAHLPERHHPLDLLGREGRKGLVLPRRVAGAQAVGLAHALISPRAPAPAAMPRPRLRWA
jgi:hypothetical protein